MPLTGAIPEGQSFFCPHCGWWFEDSIHILMMLQALAIERAAATRTAERVLH
jgi:hypothetical protein